MYQTIRRNILQILDTTQLLVPLRGFYNWSRYFFNINVRKENRQFTKNGSPDGHPLPPPALIHLVCGSYSYSAFYENGKNGADCIRNILIKNNLRIEQFSSVYDFGCGCGRVMRHWHTLKNSKLYGSDYNPALIKWCRDFLPFAEFSVNPLAERTIYKDCQFEFIYSISVFTHLVEPMQHFWIGEMKRLLKPGGYLYVTTLGTTHLYRLTIEERKLYDEGKLVVRHEKHPGSNFCLAFHPYQYFREFMCDGFTLIEYIPGGAYDAAKQDVYLLRKNLK
ncbi:MAG: class I SAM-dependent methyltransferase [Bacteroidota bacterium]